MAQCMNALADNLKVQEVPCTQRYALHNMAMCTLFNNHPYILSSSKFSANWHVTVCHSHPYII